MVDEFIFPIAGCNYRSCIRYEKTMTAMELYLFTAFELQIGGVGCRSDKSRCARYNKERLVLIEVIIQ